MTSRLVDRPCGVGFLDLSKYSKFLTCGVDDSRDVIDSDDNHLFDFSLTSHTTPELQTLPPEVSTSDEDELRPKTETPGTSYFTTTEAPRIPPDMTPRLPLRVRYSSTPESKP